MKEVKSPKKPLIYYYGVVLLVLLVFNLVITPLLLKQEVTEVDYGTFMSMTESKNIGQVQVEDQQIVFTDKDEKNVYQTNVMDDPNLTERLYESGAKFSKDVDASTSPLLSLLITGLLPMLIFIGLGQYMAKKLRRTDAGGKDSLMFGGTGKIRREGLRPVHHRASALTTWPARTRQRNRLPRSSTISTTRRNTPMSAHPCRRAFC